MKSIGKKKNKSVSRRNGKVQNEVISSVDSIKIREQPGYEIYSPWYTKQFVESKIEEKRTEIAKLSSHGDVRGSDSWNEKAKDRFMRHFDRLSDDTKRSYQDSARHFGKYLGLRRADSQVSSIVARLIMMSYIEASTLVEEYAMWMQDDMDLSPNTVNVRLAALRWFVDSARRVGWVEWKLDVKGVKVGKVRDTGGPSPAEFRRILRYVNTAEGKGGARNKLLVYMLAFMGLRISSVVSLNMDNIDFNERRFRVKWKGKGDRLAQYVWRPVGPETFDALEEWLEVRGKDPGPVLTSLSRANSKNISRIAIRSAQKIIEDIGREASTRKPLSPHAFRHFHATDSLEAEGDTRRVMKSTGHTNIKTIEAYDDSGDKAAREVSAAMEKRWLRNLNETEDEDEAEISSNTNVEIDDKTLSDLGIVTSTDAAESSDEHDRLSTGITGVDKLLGGKGDNKGLVMGSIVLLGGYPGIGKSTLARQICWHICKTNPGEKILYASGEESPEQIGEAIKRLGCAHKNFLLVAEKSVNRSCELAASVGASVLVIDSVSTVAVDECDRPTGSISQVKAIGHHLLSWCKGIGGNGGSGIAVIVISHVDKKGNIAGPKALEHHVDAVFSFMSPSKRSKMRSLGCEGKNRFGDSSGEIFFQMTKKGLVEQHSDGGGFGYEDEEEDEDDDGGEGG